MEILSNLKTFAKILREKGYDGLYSVKGGSLGSLEEVLADQLAKPSIKARPKSNEVMLRGSMKWSTDENVRFDCSIWVKHIGAKFFLHRMKFEKRTGSGRIIKSFEITNPTVITSPSVRRVIALLQKQK